MANLDGGQLGRDVDAMGVPAEDRHAIPSLLFELAAPGETIRAIARVSLREWRYQEGYAVVTDRRLIVVHDDPFIDRGIIDRIRPRDTIHDIKIVKEAGGMKGPDLEIQTPNGTMCLQFHSACDLDYVKRFQCFLQNATTLVSPRPAVSMLETDGEQLSVETYSGRADMPAVIFSNGLDGTASQWEPVAQLIPELTSIGFDRPGFGNSPRSNRSSEKLQVECDRMMAVADAIAPDQPLIAVGWSYGGVIAEATARLNPERVCGLVLVDSHPTHESAQGLNLGVKLFDVAADRVAITETQKEARRNRNEELARIWPHAADARTLEASTSLDTVPIRVLIAQKSTIAQLAPWEQENLKFKRNVERFVGHPDLECSIFRAPHEMMKEVPRQIAEAIRDVVSGRGLLVRDG